MAHAITTNRPNAVGATDNFAAGLGAGTNLARVGDGLDSTSIRAAISTHRTAYYNITNYVQPAASNIRRTRMGVRYQNAGTPATFSLTLTHYITDPNNGTLLISLATSTVSTASSTATTVYTGWQGWGYQATLGGGYSVAASQAIFNTSQLYVDVDNSSEVTNYCDILDVWIEVETDFYPTLTVNTPTGTYTASTRPVINTTYNDADGDNMFSYDVRIFSAAQYGIGGFDPNLSPYTADISGFSSTAPGGTFNVACTVDLVNGTTYKAYVSAQSSGASGTPVWAVGPAFTVTLDAPAQPALTAVADTVNNRITGVFSGRDNKLSKNAASVETSVADWTVIGANASIAQSATFFANGAFSVALTKTVATNDAGIGSPTGVSGIPVTIGTTYTVLASIRSSVARTARVDIVWYTSGGAVVSTTTGSASATSAAGFTQFTVSAAAPATAAFATMNVIVIAAVAADIHYFDKMSFAPGTSTTWTRGGFVDANQTYYLERSADAGATWTAVRSWPNVGLKATDETLAYTDYEAPLGVTLNYRGRVSGVDTGLTLTGINTANVAVGPLTPVGPLGEGWWIKNPLLATDNMALDINSIPWNWERQLQQAVYRPLGRTYPVVVSDVANGINGTFTAEFISKTSRDAFDALFKKMTTLLLQRIQTGEQWYIQMIGKAKDSERNTNPIIYEYTVDFVEVDTP